MNMNFTVNKRVLVLALALAGCSAGSLWAASTPTTAPVKGSAPVLSAPSNGAVGAVDFSGTYATEGKLSTGDTLVMTYQYNDSDGDLDASLTTVTWSYLDDAGQSVTIPATNAPAAASGSNGTSTITIPAVPPALAPSVSRSPNIRPRVTLCAVTSSPSPTPVPAGPGAEPPHHQGRSHRARMWRAGSSCNLIHPPQAVAPLIMPVQPPIHRSERLMCSVPGMTATATAYGMQAKPT